MMNKQQYRALSEMARATESNAVNYAKAICRRERIRIDELYKASKYFLEAAETRKALYKEASATMDKLERLLEQERQKEEFPNGRTKATRERFRTRYTKATTPSKLNNIYL